MTDKEVMQMALETLEQITPDWRTSIDKSKQLNNSIETLRTALAQPEKEWVGLTDAEAMEIEDKSPDIRWAIIQAEAKLKEKNT